MLKSFHTSVVPRGGFIACIQALTYELLLSALALSVSERKPRPHTSWKPPATTTFPVVSLPDGELPKGTIVSGHVVESSAFRFDSSPYAKQQPSYISVHFDKAIADSCSIPLHVTMRALANRPAAYDARTPQTYGDEQII
jgi:hypothetical protein